MPDRLVLDPVEQRVLGALLEKQRTVPDTYPLSLNALRAACNQSTSRDPVVDYDETTLLDGLGRLRDRELVRFVKTDDDPGREVPPAARGAVESRAPRKQHW